MEFAIDPYVFEPGDLSQPGAFFGSSWAYIPKRGFFRVETARDYSAVIPEADVLAFVTENRAWVNHHKGFHLHLNPVRTELDYKIDEAGNMSFVPHLVIDADAHGVKDFGRLVYFSGQGFFAKETSYDFLKVRPYQNIYASRVSGFIREHCDELVEIPHFFCDKSPFKAIGLRVGLLDDGETIEVAPVYEFIDKNKGATAIFYDEFVYIPGDGFYEIPPSMRLPEGYRSAQQIGGAHRIPFLREELPGLMRHVIEIHPSLVNPNTSRFVVKEITQEEATGEYNLKCILRTNIGDVPLPSIWWALHRHQHVLFSPGGFIDLTDKRWHWLKDLPKERVDRRSQSMTLNGWQLLRLNALEDLSVDNEGREEPIRMHPLFNELLNFSVSTPPNIKGLQCELRPYQSVGINWLWFLYTHNLSGLLCDDMGLGQRRTKQWL